MWTPAGLAVVAGLLIAKRRAAVRRGGASALSDGKPGPFARAPPEWSAPPGQRPAPHARYSSRHSASWVLHSPDGGAAGGDDLVRSGSSAGRMTRDDSSVLRPASGATPTLHTGASAGGHGSGSARVVSGTSGPLTAEGTSGAPATARSTAVTSDGSGGGGGGSKRAVAEVRGEVQQAVAALQGALQEELHEDELQLYDVLGRGGFGTVYHGASPPPAFPVLRANRVHATRRPVFGTHRWALRSRLHGTSRPHACVRHGWRC